MLLPTVQIQNILFPTDLSDHARYAFAYATSLADQYGAKITLLHVLPENQQEADTKEKWEEIKHSHYRQSKASLTGKIRHHAMTRKVRDLFASGDAVADFADEIIIGRGSEAAAEIIRQVEERHCDLVVMGSRGRSSTTDAPAESITASVLKRSPVPVLVVRLPDFY